MALRVCATTGCPTLIPQGTRGGRCTTHQRTTDRARGTREQRGYGAAHQAQRAALVTLMQAGHTITCIHCGRELTAATLHLDHDDDREGYRGASCATCNTSLAGKKRHAN